VEKLVGQRHWRVGEITMPDGPWLMLVGSNRRIPHDLMDAYQMLAVQRSFAELRARSHADLDHQVNHDALTSLPNRTQFFSQLAGAVDAGGSVALIVIDLDDFKIVNDTYGHAAGDELLIAVALRLREAAGEQGVPARFGGDEFAVLLPGADEAEALAVAGRVRDVLRDPIALTGTTVCSRASVGLALNEPQMTATDLMRCADIAMYWAKARGKGRVEQYTPDAHGDVVTSRMMEEHLPYAVSWDELVVHYQPHVDLASQECIGAEALVRWQHPTLGLVPPAAFIPIAEVTGQIGMIGAYVLGVACRQMAEWNRSTGQPLRLAVNVAARQLLDGDFPQTVQRALAESGLPAKLLTLEPTESEIIDEQNSVRQLCELAELGVRISIDDFGTGYTSLASLRSFPVHQIKIDRSFVETRDTERAKAMLQLIISVGQVLDLETVAEGVETEDQRTALVKAGVPLAQGYLFGRPMPAEDFAAWYAAARSTDRPTTSARTAAPA
jgi:diguanylate cyclase (GGDEF)-like protein